MGGKTKGRRKKLASPEEIKRIKQRMSALYTQFKSAVKRKDLKGSERALRRMLLLMGLDKPWGKRTRRNIMYLQAFLKVRGYKLSINGYYDKSTMDAIKLFNMQIDKLRKEWEDTVHPDEYTLSEVLDLHRIKNYRVLEPNVVITVLEKENIDLIDIAQPVRPFDPLKKDWRARLIEGIKIDDRDNIRRDVKNLIKRGRRNNK